MRFSIIVCAYNAEERLYETFRHLAQQRFPKGQWEVVLVDNNSSDATSKRAASLWREFGTPAPINIVHEPEQGLTYARQKGVASAVGQFCVFCDDDNWLHQDYLLTADKQLMGIGDRSVLGGASTPRFDCSLEQVPAHFYSNAISLALGAASFEAEDVTDTRGWLMGAGLIVPRAAFEALADLGFRQLLKDRTGKSLSTGGDVEICYALSLMGYRLWSIPEMRFEHLIPQGRFHPEYLKSLKRENGRASRTLAPYKALRAFLRKRSTRMRRIAACLLEYVRHPDLINKELLKFSLIGVRGRYTCLPVYLLPQSK